MLEHAKKLLAYLKLDYKVLIDDLAQKIKTYNPKITPEDMKLQEEQGYNFTFKYYHSLEDMHEYLDHLSTTYKDFVSTQVIGKSIEGRDLKVLTISSGDPTAPGFWIDAGIHAREWIAPTTAIYIARELVERRETLPSALKKINFFILPVVNPDGYEFSRSKDSHRLWRKNRNPNNNREDIPCYGVDLNRNFDMEWGVSGSSDDPCADVYKGPTPNSELETQAVTNFVSRIPRIKASVSLHSYSNLILYPFGYAGGQYHPNHEELHRVGVVVAQRIKALSGNNYGVQSSGDWYVASGDSADWAASRGIPYVFTMELSDCDNILDGSCFILPPSKIIPIGKEGFELIKATAEAILESSHPKIAMIPQEDSMTTSDSFCDKEE
ncbi:carboxypeptidase B-like [Bemisia tabaci]